MATNPINTTKPFNIDPNATFTFNSISTGNISLDGHIIPEADITYDLGNATNRFRDLYLSGNTIYLGDTAFSTTDILNFDLNIAPEILGIQVQAPEAGDDIHWLWTWQQSTLPFARATITNQQQISVPLYNSSTYTIDNFAGYEAYGNMTQVHKGYFKWVEGAGLDNQISWANTYTQVTTSNSNINDGADTSVQRYTFTVPDSANLVIPTAGNGLSYPANIEYQVSVDANIPGVLIFGATMETGSELNNVAEGQNPTIGPMYRGGTYTFNLDTTGHPFYLTTDNGSGFVANTYVGEYTSGVTGSRNTSGTLTITVPNNAPDTLYYQCAVHASMRGSIRIKDLVVETNINGNPIVYFQHTHEGHVTPIELRPLPTMVNQMCLVYDQTSGKFVPQDLATYVENTPSFKNKIREVAGTATLVAPDGVAVVPTVLVVEDVSYLPLVDNTDGDIAFDQYTNTMYVWSNNSWKNTKPTSLSLSTGNISITGGTNGQVLTTNGSGTLSWTTPSGSGGSAELTKTMEFWDVLVVFNGTKRWYATSSFSISNITSFLVSAPTGQDAILRINKNGTPTTTINITDGDTFVSSNVTISMTSGDYITVDITQIGSTSPGAYLSTIFTYQ